MSTLQVDDLRVAFNAAVEEVAPTIPVTHHASDKMLSCDLGKYELTPEELRAIRETIKKRSDTTIVEIDGGALRVSYRVGGLHGAKLNSFVGKLQTAIQRLIARKLAYQQFPDLQHHTN